MPETILRQDLPAFINRAFLNYAMSVITDRALADNRDGLKPVHRRIIQSMYHLGLSPNARYMKSARTVGDVMGKTHPHGDSSIYGAMVTLAQNFNMRYPLIDGQGNWGSVDGDPAAAMRYTESRLSRYGYLMVEEMNKDTFDTRDNFDSTMKEAVYLPTLFANNICNGATEGIAVGMASKMVPHNLTEVYNAFIASIDVLIAKQDITTKLLLTHIKGPDLPLGGQIIGTKGIYDYFETGRGKIVIRSKYEMVEKKSGTEIVITEIPFKVNKQVLVDRINDLTDTHLKEVKEAEDESDKKGMSIVIRLKKNVNTNTVIQKLCKYTDFEVNYSINNNLLFNGQPFVANMPYMVTHFIRHAQEVVFRKETHKLNKMVDRVNYLNIILWGIANSETIVPIVKSSDSTDDLLEALKEIAPDITSEQAKIIGDIRTRQYSAGNVQKYTEELNTLLTQIEVSQATLADEALLLEEVKKEFVLIKDKYGDKRRTEIIFDEKSEITVEDLLDDEELIMTYTTDHLIKTSPESDFRATRRGAKGVSSGVNDEESLKYMISISNKDTLMFFTSKGRCHTLKAFNIPKMSRTSKGRSIHNFLTLEEDEVILNIINVNTKQKDHQEKCLVFVTRQGVIKKLDIDKLSSVRNVTKVITFKEDDMLINASLTNPSQEFVICTAYGIASRFDLSSVRASGRGAAGVTGIKFKIADDYVVDATPVEANHKMLTITETGYGKLSEFNVVRKCNRGSKGAVCHKVENSKLVAMISVEDIENDTTINEIIMATQAGQMIRIDANQIRECGRNAKGVKLVNLQEGDSIVAVSLKQSEVELNDEQSND